MENWVFKNKKVIISKLIVNMKIRRNVQGIRVRKMLWHGRKIEMKVKRGKV